MKTIAGLLLFAMAAPVTAQPGASPLRPKLQIINGSNEAVDIFWLKNDRERVPNGSLEAGKDTTITTTLGHRFAIVGRDDKAESIITSEVPVQAFRFGGVPAFYTQQVEAHGFPIVASAKVNPYALKEAAYLIDLMLAKRPDVRKAMIKSGCRMCLLAHNEFTTDLPEFVRMADEPSPNFPNLSGKDFWDARARGTGGSQDDPFCTSAEENILFFPGDPYSAECILIHEFAHAIHLRGMVNVDPTFDARLKKTYDAAMKAGLWKGKYAAVNHHEYFAEGVQSWFDNNRVNDHDHNHVHLRSQLIDYDPGLAAMCRDVFGDTELRYTKPITRLTGHMAGYDPAKAPTFVWPEHLKTAREQIMAKAKARDAKSNDAKTTKPNVLFIAVDDMRCELGCYGAKHVLTPNLDKLAASGVLFTRAYCQQAVCNPSRASLMTGLRPDATQVWDLDTDFRTKVPDAVTIPQHFRANGYRAEAFGKIFHNTFPDEVSWDEPTHKPKGVIAYSEENEQRLADFKDKMKSDGKTSAAINRMRGPATEVQEQPDEMNFDGKQTTEALEKLRELGTGKSPFFLAVGFIRPHLPFITPRKYWDLYDRAKIPLATNPFLPHDAPAVAFGDKSFGGFYELRDYMNYADAPTPFEASLTEAQQRELKHGYYASVSFIDAQVGRLLAGLDELKLASNTVVVLWSDHGWKLGEHNGWCKQTNYEIDTRAPLMIRAPGAKSNGQPCNSLVEFVDIYPTLCELAHLPTPKNLAGKSLAPLLEDATASVKDAAFSQFPRLMGGRDHMGYAMRTDRYRYVEWLDAVDGKIVARELYDHASDAGENENLAVQPEHTKLLDSLSAKLWKHLPRPKFPLAMLQAAAGASASLTWHPANGKPLPRSKPAGEYQNITFTNARPDSVEIVWLGTDDSRKSYRKLKQNEIFSIRTRPGAVWLILDTKLQPLGHFVVESRPGKTAKAVVPAAADRAGASLAPPRESRTVSGWPVRIDKALLDSQREATEHALVLLKQMLDEIIRVVPAKAVAELQKVPLYFSPTYPGSRGGAEFHPEAGWLKDNGRDPIMAKGVEFSNIPIFEQEMNRMPNFVLHELAHAYHNRVIKGSFDNADIKAAYGKAKASGSYDKIERWHGNGKPNTHERAYAMTNPQEYFAETTEAFFVRNDFFPFTREELQKHDPDMFAVLERMWGTGGGK